MSVIRLLNNGSWSKPPVLTAARKILIDGLAGKWQKTELGDLATFVNGTSYDRGQLDDSGTPIIRISNITDPRSEYLTTNQSFDNRYVVQPNDLLVSWSASFKSVIWPGPTGVLNQHIFKVTEKPGNHRGFIRHAIEAVFDDMQSKVVGIGMMHLRRRDFLGYQVPAPDYCTQEAVCRFLDWLETPNNQSEPTLPSQLSEQRRIVARVGELAARIEEARGLRQQAVEEAEAVWTTGAQRLLFELDAQSVPLRELVAVQGGGTPSKKDPALWNGDIPWVSPKDMKSREIRRSADYITETATLTSSAKLIDPGAVLIVVRGMILAHTVPSSVLRVRATVNQDMKALLPNEDILPEYLCSAFWALNRHVLELVEKSSHDTRKLRTPTLLDFRLPVPSLPEQQRIVAYLDNLQAKVDSLKRLQAETAAELDALLPSVLDRAFKGEL